MEALIAFMKKMKFNLNESHDLYYFLTTGYNREVEKKNTQMSLKCPFTMCFSNNKRKKKKNNKRHHQDLSESQINNMDPNAIPYESSSSSEDDDDDLAVHREYEPPQNLSMKKNRSESVNG
jgi:hypothetical protein